MVNAMPENQTEFSAIRKAVEKTAAKIFVRTMCCVLLLGVQKQVMSVDIAKPETVPPERTDVYELPYSTDTKSATIIGAVALECKSASVDDTGITSIWVYGHDGDGGIAAGWVPSTTLGTNVSLLPECV